MIFVYVKGLRGPAPEKWPEMIRDMNGKSKPVLALHVLDSIEASLSIAQLTRIYPPPDQPIPARSLEQL